MGRRRRTALLLIAVSIGACSMAPHRSDRLDPPSPTAVAHANEVLIRALGLVGTPYRYGGDTPDHGFDCSGLVSFVYREAAGIDLPHNSADIGRIDAPEVDADDLTGGDVLLFAERGRVSHVGIYVGDGRFVHAPKHGGAVRIDELESAYWREHYVGARRLL